MIVVDRGMESMIFSGLRSQSSFEIVVIGRSGIVARGLGMRWVGSRGSPKG